MLLCYTLYIIYDVLYRLGLIYYKLCRNITEAQQVLQTAPYCCGYRAHFEPLRSAVTLRDQSHLLSTVCTIFFFCLCCSFLVGFPQMLSQVMSRPSVRPVFWSETLIRWINLNKLDLFYLRGQGLEKILWWSCATSAILSDGPEFFLKICWISDPSSGATS